MEVEDMKTSEARHYGETCTVCEQKKESGIHLYTSFICKECEREIVNTDTSDANYEYFVQQLKKASTPKLFS
jgi:hypothetical protein